MISRKGEIDMVQLEELVEDLKTEEGEIDKSSRNKKIGLACLAFALIFIGGELLIYSAENLIEYTGISVPKKKT